MLHRQSEHAQQKNQGFPVSGTVLPSRTDGAPPAASNTSGFLVSSSSSWPSRASNSSGVKILANDQRMGTNAAMKNGNITATTLIDFKAYRMPSISTWRKVNMWILLDDTVFTYEYLGYLDESQIAQRYKRSNNSLPLREDTPMKRKTPSNTGLGTNFNSPAKPKLAPMRMCTPRLVTRDSTTLIGTLRTPPPSIGFIS